MAKTLYASISGCTHINDIRVSDSHSANSASAIITCESTTLSINDSISITLGYVGDNATVFSGYVKQIDENVPDDLVTITAQDVMVRAMDYFIASADPENPLKYQNIQAETLVGNLMSLAGLTSYSGSTTNFEFGLDRPIEINLVSSYEFSRWVADLLAWHIYADTTGKVWFVDRKPYVMGGDSSSLTVLETETISITKNVNERDLRNRVVVYGRTGVKATASASSAYLPAGYYKTVVVASEWIANNTLAQTAADYNLTKLNRLTTQLSLSIEGNPNISARDIISVNNTFLSLSNPWYVFAIEHQWNNQGYLTNMQLRQ